MRRQLVYLYLLITGTMANPAFGQILPEYPATPKGSAVDSYTARVEDPYRWLEADLRADAKVADWVSEQNIVARSQLDAIVSRPLIHARLKALHAVEQESVPIVAGEWHFYYRRPRDAEQPVYWVRQGEKGVERMLLDPRRWSAEGRTALASAVPSPDGRLVAFALQQVGSDWRTWQVIDVASGAILADRVGWNKFSDVVWTGDSRGFYYTRYPEPVEGGRYRAGNAGMQMFFHRIGTDQTADEFVYSDEANPDFTFIPAICDDAPHLLVNTGYTGGGPTMLLRDKAAAGWRDLFPGQRSPLTSFRLVACRGPDLYFLTNANAPNGKLIALDISDPDARPRDIITERRFPLVGVSRIGDELFARYLEDAQARVLIYSARGEERGEIDLPGAGSVSTLQPGQDSSSVYFAYSSFAVPRRVYRYDLASKRTTQVSTPDAPIDDDDYRVEQRFFTARDGKRIPMYLAYRAGVKADGHRPVLLYGYGGFGLSFAPDFRPEQVTWMDMGGVFAFPALPGGGEYGEAWHNAGRLKNKPAVFDAFIDAAEYLIAQGWTSRDQLAIFGYSNGGLLVGAAMTMRPDLFRVALPTVGVLDMLRFPEFTNGRLWTVEFGSPDDPEMFPVLHGYSPYHQIRAGVRYPATLIGTGDTDDRVYPAHSFKFAARLQERTASGTPILLSTGRDTGHGAGSARSQVIEDAADRLAFTHHYLGFPLAPSLGRSGTDAPLPDGD